MSTITYKPSPESAATNYSSASWETLRIVLLFGCAIAVYFAQGLMQYQWPVLNETAIASVAVAFSGSSVHSPSIIIGALGSLLAGLLFGILSSPMPRTWQSAPSDSTGCGQPHKKSWTAIALALMSLLLMAAVQVLYLRHGESLAAREVWGMSVALFTGASLLGWRARRLPPQVEKSPPFSRWWLIVFALTVFATLLLRVVNLEELPHKLVPDVSHVGRFSRDNLESGWKLFGVGFFGIPQMAFSVTSLSMLAFGDNLVGVRMADVLLGTAMVAFVYLCVWRGMDTHRVAAVAAAVLGASAVHNIFSRHIFNLDPWAIFCVVGFIAIHGIRARSSWLLGVAGVALGVSLQLYLSIRILGVVLPCFVAYLAITRPKLLWEQRWGGVLLILGVVIAAAPNTVDLLINQEMWQHSNRFDVSLLNSPNLRGYMQSAGLLTVAAVVRDRFVECLLVFQSTEDGSGQFSMIYPFIDPYIAPLMWLGLGVSVRNFRRNPLCAFLLLSFIGTLVASQGISYTRRAAWPRIFWTLPIASIFISIGVCALADAAQRLVTIVEGVCRVNSHLISRMTSVVSSLVITALLIFLALRGWHTVKSEGAVDNYPVSHLARFVGSQPAGIKVCLIAGNELNLEFPELRFLGHGRVRRNIAARSGPEAVAECGDGPLVWIVNSADVQLATAVQARFPQAHFERHVMSNGQAVFETYSSL